MWCKFGYVTFKNLNQRNLQTHSKSAGLVTGIFFRAHLFNPGSYLRLIDSCITQLKAQEPSRTCNESKEEDLFVFLNRLFVDAPRRVDDALLLLFSPLLFARLRMRVWVLARPVHLIITMIKWIRTSRLSIKNTPLAPLCSPADAVLGFRV